MPIPTANRGDMDSVAIVRHAHERGERPETCDPNRLLLDIEELLRQRGLHPELPPGSGRAGTATAATGMLLRAFGILPAGDHTTIDRVDAPDPESR